VFLCLKTKKEPASKTSCVFKKYDNGYDQRKTVSVNFCHALLSLLFPLGYAGFGFA